MTFGEYLRNLRSQRGMSQRDLAEMSKVSNAEICRLETGERLKPSPKVIKAIAPCLGVTYEEMMVKAGYIDRVIDHDAYTEHIFEGVDSSFVDTVRMAKNITGRDNELISILERAVESSSKQDLDTIKAILNSFIDNGLSEGDKYALKSVLDKFSKK